MPEYGITETGLRIKRLDVILDEINADQTAGFGVKIGTNQRSFLNVLNTSFADKIAELWGFRQVERHLRFHFGQVLGDRDISHYRSSSFFTGVWGLGGSAAVFPWSWASTDFFAGGFWRQHSSSRAKPKSLRSSMRCSQ